MWKLVFLGILGVGVVGRNMINSTRTNTRMEQGRHTQPLTSTSSPFPSQNGSISISKFLVLRSLGGGFGRNGSGEGGGVVMQGEGVGTGTNEEMTRSGSGIGGGIGCGSHFMVTAMSENITRKCIDLIGFKMENFPPKDEDLIKINYEDKCFSKCYLTELNYMTATDNFDPLRIMEELRKETPPEKLPGRIRAIKGCLQKTEEMAVDEGGVPNSPCKFGLVFFSCARHAEKKMIC